MSEYIDSLDPEQRAAVLAPAVPLKVMAGAGSGKTRVIISRIAHQIDTGAVAPDKVFASAFTKSAATEMSDRIKSLVDADDLVLATFHSLMFRFIRDWTELNGGRYWGVMKQWEQKRLFLDLLNHPTRDYPDALNVDVDIREVMGRIGRWKNQLIHHYDDEITETIEESPKTVGLGAAARIYQLYESYKSKMGKIDFDDMLLMAYDILVASEKAQSFCRGQWDAFFIDEAQDTNHAQWEIVKLIAPPDSNPNITIVGDTRQCLYRFRGAIPELMDNFDTMYPTAQTIDLVKNYRSTRQVIKRANTLITDFQMIDQEPVRGDGPDAIAVSLIDERDQAEQIARLVTEAKRREYRGGDIAVLVRTNAQTIDIERAFVLARHPYWCRGGGFFSHREIADILAYIRIAVDPKGETGDDGENPALKALGRIINKPTRYLGKAFVEAVERNLSQASGDIIEALAITDRYSNRSLSKSQRLEKEKLIWFLQDLQKPEHTSRSMVEAVLGDLNYLEWLKKNEGIEDEDGDSRIENVDALRNACWEYEKPADLLAFSDMTDKLQLESGDAVELVTVHRAKGREWPIVVMSNFYEKSVPHVMAIREGGEPDERRIAYVAYTRAEDLLVVTFPQETIKYKSVEPSRYLADSEIELMDGLDHEWWGDAFDRIEERDA